VAGRSQVGAILLSKRSSNNRILSALSAKNQPPAATPVGRIYIEKRYYETITVVITQIWISPRLFWFLA
jgi:hypothetical protein